MLNPMALMKLLKRGSAGELTLDHVAEVAAAAGLNVEISDVKSREEIPAPPPGSRIVKVVMDAKDGSPAAFALLVIPGEAKPNVALELQSPEESQLVYKFS